MRISACIGIVIVAACGLVFPQSVTWRETTQPDFADGYIDPNLYASWRYSLEAPVYRGAVEWFPRFDLDGNGYPDFVSPDFNSPCSLRIWFMGPSGLDHFQFIPMSNSGGDCDFADLDWDGDAEIIHSGYWTGRTTIYWNSGGVFSESDTTIMNNDDGEAVYVADLDADGYLDIIVGGDHNTLYIYWGASGMTHPWGVGSVTTFNLFSSVVHNIECADLDNDADLDLLVLHLGGSLPLVILRNLGGRTFDQDTLLLADVGSDWHHGLSVGDLNRDGFVDIVTTNCNYTGSGTDLAEIFINDGTGFSAPTTATLQLHPGPSYGGSALHDFNDDGWLDILFFRSHPEGSLVVCLNSGGTSPLFSDADCYAIGPYEIDATGGTVIDVDGDGADDIFVNAGSPPGGYSLLLWGPSYTTCDSFPNNYDHHGVFREPGNIRDRSKSAFYESNIFDTGFEFGACDGTVSWIAYDERDYSGAILPDPVGSEVIILARAGDHPTPDATWTDWDTLTDGGALPPSILGHRYYQYRAELWYSNPAYLPWLEEIEFTFSPCSCPEIDSVWFFEETYTDSQNLVQICYDAEDPDGDSFFVEIHIYDDTIEIPIATVYDTVAGYPGPNMGWVDNGTHCFVWNLGTDYYGHEGCDFTVQVSIHNETTEFMTVSDSISIPDPEGIAWDGEYLWISSIRTAYSDTVVVYKVDPITHEILDSCVFTGEMPNMYADIEWHSDTLWMMQGPGRRIYLVDPATCTVMDSAGPMWSSSRWGQGIAYRDGYIWITDSHGLIYRVDMSSPYSDTFWMSLEDTFWTYHPGETLFAGSRTVDAFVWAMNYWWVLRNPASGDVFILFQFDSTGQVIDSFALPTAGTYGPEGLTYDGSCFWYTDHSNDMVYRVCLWGCDDTMTVIDCLDSKSPDVSVNFYSCDDTLFVGDTVYFGANVIDSFFDFYDDSCLIEVLCGDIPETSFWMFNSDTQLILNYPPCDSMRFVVTAIDSFGNVGVDTSCYFVLAPCVPATAWVVCPIEISFNSCETPYVIFEVLEPDSTPIDTSRTFFTFRIYNSGVLVDSIGVSPPDPYISVSGTPFDLQFYCYPPVSDEDSVAISLDSTFNIYGCQIFP